ncbi:MAG: PilZ domain-containing protein [Planctomycetes bacterium]|nr:PilZ domain-containing protein [Planctomycetota bacterium]
MPSEPPFGLPPQPANPAPGSDRRRAVRFPPPGWVSKVTLPRTLMGLGGGQTVNAPLLDLSELGARIVLPQEISKGGHVRIRIEDPKFKDVVEVHARVAWVNPPPPVATSWIVGVEFIELPREHQLKISGWRSYYTSDEFLKQHEVK